jgi:hypothetical protein
MSRMSWKPILMLVIFTLLILAGCAKQPSSQNTFDAAVKTWYVDNGTDPGGILGIDCNPATDITCGTAAKPWRTIQYAVNSPSVLAGDTIKVKRGTYNEKIRINRSGTSGNTIKLIGGLTSADWQNTIIRYTGPDVINGVPINTNKPLGNTHREGAIVLSPRNDSAIHDSPTTFVTDWYIEGFRIEGGSRQVDGFPHIGAGILMERVKRIELNRIWTYKTGISGIIVRPGNLVTCDENVIVPTTTDVLYLDTDCALQNENILIHHSGIDEPNLGMPNVANLDQEALSIWGVTNFKVYNNQISNGTKEGLTVKGATSNTTAFGRNLSDKDKMVWEFMWVV